MSALSALDVRPLASLYATRHVVLRALLTAFLPLSAGWLAFVHAFNDVEVRVDDSDFGPQLAMVGILAIPYALGHVIGLTVGELSSHPVTRLLPARRPRVRRASVVIGALAAVVTALALVPFTADVSLLAAFAAGTFGYALGDASCSVPRRAAVWAATIVPVLMVLSNANLVLAWLDANALRPPVALAAAVLLHALPFTRFGDRPHPDPVASGGVVRSLSRIVPASDAPLDRALAAWRYEAAHSPLRGELRPAINLAVFIVVLSVAGPLVATVLDRAPDGDTLTLLERLFEAFVGRTADGSVPGQGAAGTSAALAFSFGVLPLMADVSFRGSTMRPFSRATLGRLAYGVWWRTFATGALVLVGVAMSATLALGWFSGAGAPTHVPIFVKCALMLAPVAPWLTMGAIAARRWTTRRSPGRRSNLEAITVTATVAIAMLVAGACVVVTRSSEYDELLTPTPLGAAGYVAVLAAGLMALRAFYARHHSRAAIALD